MAATVGALLVFAGIAFAFSYALVGTRNATLPLTPASGGGRRGRKSFSLFVQSRLESSPQMASLEELLEAAGSRRSAASTILLSGTIAIVLAILISPLAFPIGSVLVLVTVPLVVRARLLARVRARRNAFIEQLPNTLQMLSSMLRAGYGLLQSFAAIAEEAEEPTREWFDRVMVESQAGRDLSDSLKVLASEVQSADFDWVVSAVEISREVGGDLASTFDTLAETVRERDQLRGQVRALTAEGRLSAYLMLALPPVVVVMSFLVNPEFSKILFRGVGLILLSLAGMLMVIGYFWMRRIISKVA
jgi:tight adherence protein B